jgi:hypothetical protein
MHGPRKLKGRTFSAFRTAAAEAVTKREADIMRDAEKAWDSEGGHMSSTAGRVMHVSGSDLPYVVILAHHGCDASEHGFATMREAEAFIKRNTPIPGRALSALYDRPAGD